jgi:hypothetical protein
MPNVISLDVTSLTGASIPVSARKAIVRECLASVCYFKNQTPVLIDSLRSYVATMEENLKTKTSISKSSNKVRIQFRRLDQFLSLYDTMLVGIDKVFDSIPIPVILIMLGPNILNPYYTLCIDFDNICILPTMQGSSNKRKECVDFNVRDCQVNGIEESKDLLSAETIMNVRRLVSRTFITESDALFGSGSPLVGPNKIFLLPLVHLSSKIDPSCDASIHRIVEFHPRNAFQWKIRSSGVTFVNCKSKGVEANAVPPSTHHQSGGEETEQGRGNEGRLVWYCVARAPKGIAFRLNPQ